MAIRLPTVANINYYDPNKVVTGIQLDTASQYVTTARGMGSYSQQYYATALTGDFTDSGISCNVATSPGSAGLTIGQRRYMFFGLVVPGPSASRNNIPLTYGFSGSLSLRIATNKHLPQVWPFVATVSNFSAQPTQSTADILGMQMLPCYTSYITTLDFSIDVNWHHQLTYNTYSHNTRAIFGVAILNNNSTDVGIWEPHGSLSVNALHHLREIFDPNLG